MGDVRKLMGFLNYYRRYLKNFTTRAKPLYDLLTNTDSTSIAKQKQRKPPSNLNISWNTSHQTIPESFIDELVSATIMAYPRYDSPFILSTDASNEGLGAVLYQQQDGVLRVIG